MKNKNYIIQYESLKKYYFLKILSALEDLTIIDLHIKHKQAFDYAFIAVVKEDKIKVIKNTLIKN